jgi:hypothetical protein
MTFDDLDKLAQSMTDNQAAKRMQDARHMLFNQIFEQKKQRHTVENLT